MPPEQTSARCETAEVAHASSQRMQASAMGLPPLTLEIYNHQETQPVAIERWQEQAERAVPHVLAAAKGKDAPLHRLEIVEISLVSDESIAHLHREFMGDPAATDVITFHHGEIIISLDTAQRQAAENGEEYEREVLRYIVHGLLHLAGWDDREEAERTEMHEVQENILRMD
jgi:probable rRNA maturation factor